MAIQTPIDKPLTAKVSTEPTKVGFYSGPADIIRSIKNIDEFNQIQKREVTLNTTRLDDVISAKFLVHRNAGEEKVYVLHFAEDDEHKLIAYELLKDWDPESNLVVHPK